MVAVPRGDDPHRGRRRRGVLVSQRRRVLLGGAEALLKDLDKHGELDFVTLHVHVRRA